MAVNDPYRNASPLCAGPTLGQDAARGAACVPPGPDLETIRQRLNDLYERHDCELGNIYNLLNMLKEILGLPANPRDCSDKGPRPMQGLEDVSARLMKQHAERDILLAELAGMIARRTP